jgi:hypothetical protein
MANVVKSKSLMKSISPGDKSKDKSKEVERSENVAEGADADASDCKGNPEGSELASGTSTDIVAGNISLSSSRAAKVRVNLDET